MTVSATHLRLDRSREVIGIVGAGITGLALSHYLDQRGVDHVVLEGAAAPGGAIRTLHVEGRVLELGPQRTRLTPPVEALVRDLGLTGQLITAPADLPLYAYHKGALHRAPLSLSQFRATGLLTLRGKARALLEPFTGPAREDETIGAFLTRRFGREAYERLLGPLYGGLYASDPGDMYMRHSLAYTLRDLGIRKSVLGALAKRTRSRRQPPAACTFRDGMAALPAALHARHEARIRLATPVEAIRRRGAGFVLQAGGADVAVERLVLTAPAGEAARLLRGIASDATDRLAHLTYNPLAVVHLHARGDRDGFGYQVSLAEQLATRGVTWNHSMFGEAGREGVYTAFLGGARRPDVVAESDERIGSLARGEFERVTGWEAQVLHVARVRIPAWDRTWTALDGLTLPEGVHLCTNYTARPGIPGRLREAERLADLLAQSP